MSDNANKGLMPDSGSMPEPSVSGNLESAREESRRLAQQAGVTIQSRFGDQLTRSDKLKVVTQFRRELIGPKRPGRRPKETVTAAYRDWKQGLKRVALYRKHIRGWEKLSRWRRLCEERRLVDAIRARDRREKARGGPTLANANENFRQ